MKLIKTVKSKANEYVIKAYVKWTILMWSFEDKMNEFTSELKEYAKVRK